MKSMMRYISFFMLLIFWLGFSYQLTAQDSLLYSKKSTLRNELKYAFSKKDSGQVIDALVNLAQLMESNSQSDSAVYFYLKALTAFGKTKNSSYYSIKSELGALYMKVLDYENAIRQLTESTQYFFNSKKYYEFVKNSNLLGMAYLKEKNQVMARRNFLNSIEINNTHLRDTALKIENNSFMIQYLLEEGDNNSALKLANTNIKLSEIKNLKSQLVNNQIYAASSLFNTKNFRQSNQMLLAAESLANSNNLTENLPGIYKLLSKTSLELSLKDSVLYYLDQYTASIKELTNLEIMRSSKEISEKFNSENKDNIIKYLESQNAIKTFNQQKQQTAIIILFSGLLLLGLLLYFIYRNYSNQIKNNQIINEQQKKLNEQQLQQAQKDNQIIAMEFMLRGQEGERNRIGKDLHDSLGAMLSTIKLHMSTIKPADNQVTKNNYEKTKHLLDDACEEVRKISRDMMPITLENYGLDVALGELVDKFTSVAGPQVIYQSFGQNYILSKENELFIYRIIQELINNSIKHANASEILVQINFMEDKMVITVEDDGKGFYYHPELFKGMGLKNLDYRVQYLHGEMSIDTQPNHGTTIVIEIPAQILQKSSELQIEV